MDHHQQKRLRRLTNVNGYIPEQELKETLKKREIDRKEVACEKPYSYVANNPPKM